MIKVLFVCLGNICRSPMAEGLFMHKVRKRKLQDKISADSAGTAAYHIGNQPDTRTLETLERHEITFRHKARQASSTDADEFDYIIAMDRQNFEDLRLVLPNDFKSLHLIRDYDKGSEGMDVPDPYYGDADGFENIYRILDRSLDHLLDRIEKERL